MSAEEARSSCNTCKGLDYAEWLAPRWPDELRDGPRRRVMRFPELRSSAAAGCECCSVIARGAEWAWGERPEVVGDESRYTAEDERLFQLEPVNVLCVEIKPNRRLIAWRLRPPLPFDPPRDRDSPDDVDAIEFFTPHGHPQLHSAFGYAPGVPKSLSLERAVSVIQPWLRNCDNNHAACQETNPVLPRRLIDIAGHPRLVDNGQAGQSQISGAKYATLSHRWGDEEAAAATPKTLSSNIHQRMQGIDWDELSPVFRDAIQIARALGCPYIWIDALCIVQDDRQDWRDESVKMAQVYSGAYFNLAASALKDGSRSMFRDRTINVGPSYRRITRSIDTLEVAGFSSPESRVFVRHSFDRPHHDLYGRSQFGREQETLLTRAWVFQERLLSRRTIHFGASEIMWECRNCYHCECGMIAPSSLSTAGSAEDITVQDLAAPRDGRFPWLRGERNAAVPKKAALSKICSPNAPASNVFNFWMEAVSEYSLLHLTEESDRLVALGGIARKVQEATGYTYLAGIWLEDLPRSLLWSGAGITRIRASSPGPSWSWISRKPGSRLERIHWNQVGSIFVPSPRLRIHRTGTSCEYVDGNPFGAAVCGKIQMSAACVRGTVKTIEWLKEGDEGADRWLFVDLGDLNSRLALPRQVPEGLGEAIALLGIWSDEYPINSLSQFEGLEVLCPLIGTALWDAKNEAGTQLKQDIVLFLTPHPHHENCYSRVGISVSGWIGSGEGIKGFSPSDLEELFSDAEVKQLTLV